MHPQTTFELRLIPQGNSAAEKSQNKSLLVQWLLDEGCTAFVEGAFDCDVNHDYENEDRDFYSELDGNQAPVSLFRYNREELDDLASKVALQFGGTIKAEMLASATAEWMEGWKESFRPFATNRFFVRPPWCEARSESALMDLVIEPGMAFGTGQHATTQLCLSQLEGLVANDAHPREKNVLDVGTGTGILAIAAYKLGFGSIVATDIEADAVSATLENATMNHAEVAVSRGSVPEGTFDLVIANILTVVLEKIMGDLAGAVRSHGSLLLSGILKEEQEKMTALIERVGLTVQSVDEQEGWISIVGQKL